MIKILNSANETQAILENVVSSLISEEINGEFTLGFATVINGDKSSYINYQHKVEVGENYFNIAYTEEERTQDGLFINARCEHVSYDLLSANFTAGFTAAGQFSALATTLLASTGFTVGTVEITASGTVSINEATNARALLIHLASVTFEGELEFDKYQINLLTRRGADRGVQFRYRKNLVGVKRITDNRKKVAGLPTLSYQASAAELEFEQGFIDAGVSDLEHYELGDTVKVIDEDLNLETSLRIIKESHDTEQRMQGTVEISNVLEDLTDTVTSIQETSVSKDAAYNGTSIGPENGFVATRSDNLARAIMNATDGIKIQKGDGAGNWTDAIYLDVSGNGTFSGFVLASQIIGGTIIIGSGSQTFNANATDGIWLGSSAAATAPFSVSMAGRITVRNTASGTVIIDGESNMHKIFMAGTATLTLSAGLTSASIEITHDLGYAPVFAAFTQDSLGNGSNLPYTSLNKTKDFYGLDVYTIGYMIYGYVTSAVLSLAITVPTALGVDLGQDIQYYIYKEAAI